METLQTSPRRRNQRQFVVPLWVGRWVHSEYYPRQRFCLGNDARSSRGSSAACPLEACGRTYTAPLVCTGTTRRFVSVQFLHWCEISKQDISQRVCAEGGLCLALDLRVCVEGGRWCKDAGTSTGPGPCQTKGGSSEDLTRSDGTGQVDLLLRRALTL